MLDFAVKHIVSIIITLLLALPCAVAAEFYISPDMYPAVEVFGGWGSGFTFEGGPGAVAKRFAGWGASEDAFKDVGESVDVGVNFRYFISDYVDLGVGFFHQFTEKRTAAYRFDIANIEYKPDSYTGSYFGPLYVTDTLSYRVNNFDLKFRTGVTPLPGQLIEPYLTAGIGVNYLMVRLTEQIPTIKIPYLVFDNRLLGKYTFDAAGYGGVRVNLGQTYVFVEGYYDYPFTNSYVYGSGEGDDGRIDTECYGARVGMGVRFR